MRYRSAVLGVPVVMVAAAWTIGQGGGAQPPALSRAVEAVEQLDALRSGLAATFGARGVPADRETFQQVCRPVGLRAREIAEQNGWKVQQQALKNRNPGNALDEPARRAYGLMEADPALNGLWSRSSLAGKAGIRYFRRITVERACLACHGARDTRPAFVREGYPDDRAFDFSVGDLRGVYSVFIPDSVD
jgi:hypothetical protein